MSVVAARDIRAEELHIGLFNIRNLRYVDLAMLLCVFALAGIGFATIYSAKINTLADVPINRHFFFRQMVYFTFGLGVAATIACLDYRFLIAMAPVFYGAVLLLLVAVHIRGMISDEDDVERWLQLGPLALQPSELSKITLVYMLAWYLGWVKQRIRKLVYFGLTFVMGAVPGIFILLQPDLGTAVAFGPILLGLLYVAGCKRWHLAAVIVAGLAAAPIAWEHGLKDYQRERLTSFINPEANLDSSGWQPYQSRLAVGSGQMWGKGFTKGEQTQLSYLPEHHTDFIFSVLAEEQGFVGAVSVIILYMFLLLRGLAISMDCPDASGALLGVGAVIILAFHVVINIGITIGLLPVTGTPLPFLSYGGSFLLTTMICIGTILCVNVRRGMFVD